jgi:hypothetical protein
MSWGRTRNPVRPVMLALAVRASRDLDPTDMAMDYSGSLAFPSRAVNLKMKKNLTGKVGDESLSFDYVILLSTDTLGRQPSLLAVPEDWEGLSPKS